MEVKKDILWRVYLVYFIVCVFGVSIISRVFFIQFSEGEMWRAKAKSLTTAYRDIEAVRGNIYDSEENLLATSLPFYEIGMDVTTDYLRNLPKDVFKASADSLASNLASLFPNKSKREYYSELIKARKSDDRYIVLARNVSYKDLQKVKKFPLLRKGRNKGGFVYLQTNRRELPFKVLAARTIGYDRGEDQKPVGIEGAYTDYLKGTSGQRLMQKIAGGVWMPVNDENEIEPQDGCDIISSIDVNIQDVAEHALLTQLISNKAAYGCVVLMEVKTGYIKAIANLSRKDSCSYNENYNYAIGTATEPGSTFKLASLLAVMEDGYADLDDIIDLEDGKHRYYDRVMKDSHEPEVKKVTLQRVFEISSNVGVSKIITQYYSKDPQKFVDRLYSMNLNVPLKMTIPGEATPRIKSTKDKDWYGTSLPWISIGYESLITPMQTLTLYNAVANNGIMVKPLFVKAINKKGKAVKSFPPEIINPAICSKATIDKAKQMLEGVVLNGTARNLAAASYRIAGKTGTAQIANNGLYKNGSKVSYQASFVGYFPAENPKYSCIVIVNGPSNGIYYGNIVAGPIFKEIADKVYASSLDIHKEINKDASHIPNVPMAKSGNQKELQYVLHNLNIRDQSNDNEAEWVNSEIKDSTSIVLSERKVQSELRKNIVPDLKGMMAQDALYLLENSGLQVFINGKGIIIKQSIEPGTKFTKGSKIVLDLTT